jgi:maltose-binding protein MalE
VAAVRKAGNAFTTATGIPVDVEAVELDEMEQAISSGVGPDLFMGSHTWLARLAPRGLAAPVDLEPRRDEFVTVAADAFAYDGATYGAPVIMSSVAMFFNTATVTTAPGAMSEIKELCVQLRQPEETSEDTTTTTSEGTTTTIAVPEGPGCAEFVETDVAVALALLTAGDGYLYDENTAGDVGIAAAATQAATLRGLAADGVLAVSPEAGLMVERFASGETPIVFGDIELAELISISGTPFGVAPLPILTGSAPAPFIDVIGFMAAGRGTQPETARLFLNDYLITEAAMADLFAASAGVPAYAATAAQVAADPVLSGLVTAAEAGVPAPAVAGIDEVLARLAPVLAELFEVTGPDIEDVLAAAAEIALAAN